MFGWLTKSVIGAFLAPVTHITDKIADTKIAVAKEENTERRITLEEKLGTLEQRKDIILQAQKDPFERWVRIGFALPFILYIWKLVVWDKLLGWGKTDDLSSDLWAIMFIILGGYFVDVVAKRFVK